MTTEGRKKILKRGFAKIIDEERNYISIGNVKLGRKSKWVMKYVILSKDANGIPSLIIYESQSDAENHQPKKIILIGEHTEARQTQPIDGENFCLLIINSSKDSIIFACNFYGEIIDWQTYINEVVKDIKSTRERRKKLPPIPARSAERGKKDDSSYMALEGYTNSEAKESNKYDTEDNEIYGGSNMYTVEIQENETSKRLNLHGNYTLKLYDDGFQLLDKVTENVLYSWSVNVLRRYGCSNNRFSFESGRRSETGVGNFILLTPFCKLINKSVYNMTQHAKSLSSLDLKNDSSEHTDTRDKAQRLDSREHTDSPELRYDDPNRGKQPSFESNNYSMGAPSKVKVHSTSLSDPIAEVGGLLHQGIACNRAHSPLSPLSNMHYQNRAQSDLASERFAEKADSRQRDQSGHGDFVMRGSLEAPQESHGRISPSFVSPMPGPNMTSEINSDDEENYKGQPIIKAQFGDQNTTGFGLNFESNSMDQKRDYVNVMGSTRIDSGPQYGPTEKHDHVFEQKTDMIPQYNRWRSESDPKHSLPFQICDARGQLKQRTYENVQPSNTDPTPRFEATVFKDTQEGPRYSNQQLMQQQMLGASFPQQRPYLQPQNFPVPEQSIEPPQFSGYHNIPQSMSALSINELSQRRPGIQEPPQLNSHAGEIMRHPPRNINLEQRQLMSIQQSSSYPQVAKYPVQQQDQHKYPETQQMVLNPYNYQGTPQQLPPHSQANVPHGYTVSGPTLTVNSIMQPNNVPGVFSNSAPSTMKHPQREYGRPNQ